MFSPKYPTPDTYTPTAPVSRTVHPTAVTPAAPAPVAPAAAPARPSVQITPAGIAVGVGAVVAVGAVLVSMLLAVAITAGSLALLAVVLRSILNDSRKR
jgi:hypothetical protein